MAEKDDSVLVVVDMQERLLSTIPRAKAIVGNVESLVKAAAIHEVPIILIEQEKLGGTTPELKECLIGLGLYAPLQKNSFSCFRDRGFREALGRSGRKQVLLCGIETHICVSQTAADLVENGYRVQLIKDATHSYREEDFEHAVNRMQGSGVIVTTTEALIYELTGSADSPAFKEILDVVKTRRKNPSPDKASL